MKRYSLFLDPEILEKIKKKIAAAGGTVSDFIRKAIEEKLK